MKKERSTVVVSARIPIPQRAELLKATGVENPSVAIKYLIDLHLAKSNYEGAKQETDQLLLTYATKMEHMLESMMKYNWWQFYKWKKKLKKIGFKAVMQRYVDASDSQE